MKSQDFLMTQVGVRYGVALVLIHHATMLQKPLK